MNTIIYDALEKLYASSSRNLREEIDYFLRHGYMFSGPTYFICGQRIMDGWHVHCAIGPRALYKFCQLMPYYLPFIGWAREAKNRNIIKWYRSERVFKRIGYTMTDLQRFQVSMHRASQIVEQYRATAPAGYDPRAFGGMPSATKPPAPPTSADAANSVLNQGTNKRKPMGYSSTILTKPPGLGDTSGGGSNLKSILGG